MHDSFSARHGYKGPDREIVVRDDAPDGLRYAIPLIAQDAGIGPSAMRRTICQVLLVRPDPNNWSEYPNVWEEVNDLIGKCPWFRVYDVAEALYASLSTWEPEPRAKFEERLNQYFREEGIGWQMIDGRIAYRGSETFGDAINEAVEVLEGAGRSSASNEIHEALRDISRRPSPDVTGAIQHAIAALECTAREVTGEPNLTLGRLVAKLDLVRPLDTAVEKLWGYASERARHIREGNDVSTDEAELVVSIACVVCTFLTRREAMTRSNSSAGS